MRVADLLVKSLEQEGVEYIFGVPGEENLDLMDALLNSSIQFITTHHEQGAAFMAGFIGKLTGKPGVCLSTLGPGATNLVTGVADANMDRFPLVAITGQAGLDRQHKESHQYYDMVSLFKPITKWNTSIQTKEIVPEVVRKAFHVATSEKPGATHIELPEDVAAMEVDGEPLSFSQTHMEEAGDRDIEKASSLINGSKRPLILVGNGVTREKASNELIQFAEKLNSPVVHTFMGTGALPWDHPLCLVTAGLQERDHVACGFDHADLIITVGFDMAEYHPYLWNPDGAKPVLHVDTMPAEIDAHYPVRGSVVGHLPTNLAKLRDKVPQRTEKDTFTRELREEIIAELRDVESDNAFPLKPAKIVSDLRSVLEKDDIVISDVGAHKMWLARMYPTYEPNTCMISNGFAAMGVALPGAIATKLVNPDKNVVAVIGDGAFQMSLQELETAVRLQLPLVILIWSDQRYGLIEWKQMNTFKRPSHIEFGNPDFVQLAKAYGAEGMRIEGAEELKPTLEKALGIGKPVVIECPVDYRENFKLTEKLGKIVCPS